MLLVLTLMAAMFPLLGAAYEEKTGTITCTPGYVVNMRSNAGTDNPIVCTLERGDRVTIMVKTPHQMVYGTILHTAVKPVGCVTTL